MKNKLIAKGVIFICFVYASCSYLQSGAASLSIIPDDTNLIYKLNLGTLLQKVDVQQWYRSDLLKEPLKNLRDQDRALSRIINYAVDNPDVLGIDLEESVFVYFREEAEDEKYFCIAFDLDDEENFKAFVDRVVDKLGMEADAEEGRDYKYYMIEGSMSVGWDRDKALLILPDNYASRENLDFEMENLMTLNEAHSIKNRSSINDFCYSNKDISAIVNSNLFENDFRFKTLEDLYDFALEDNLLIAHMEVTKDEVLFDGRFVFNEEIESFIETYDVLDNSINAEMLKYLPKASFLFSSLSFNPSDYYEFLSDEEDFEEVSAGFKRAFGLDIEYVFNVFTGNFAFSVHGFKEDERESYGYTTRERVVPIYSVIFEMKDTKRFEETINDDLSGSRLKKKSKYYEINDMGDINYLAINKELGLLTNDKRNINLFLRDGHEESFQSSELKANVLKNNFYAYVDLDYDNYPSNIKKQLRNNQGRRDRAVFKAFTKLLRYASIEQNGNSEFRVSVGLKDFDWNDIEPLIDLSS